MVTLAGEARGMQRQVDHEERFRGQFYLFTFPEGDSVFRFVTTDVSSFNFILKVRGGLLEKWMLKLGS